MLQIDAGEGPLTPEVVRAAMARIQDEIPQELLAGAVWRMSENCCAQWENCSLLVVSITHRPTRVPFAPSSEVADAFEFKRAVTEMGGIPVKRCLWMKDEYVILQPWGGSDPIVIIHRLGPIWEEEARR